MRQDPFLIYRVVENGIRDIVHLQPGASREQYGDILDSYTVKNYCDTADILDLGTWNLGHPTICSTHDK